MTKKKKHVLLAGGAVLAATAIGVGIFLHSKKASAAPAPLPASGGGGALPPPTPVPTSGGAAPDQNVPGQNQNQPTGLPAAGTNQSSTDTNSG